jgi:hypothetical protein
MTGAPDRLLIEADQDATKVEDATLNPGRNWTDEWAIADT